MISFADIPLIHAPPDLVEWIGKAIPPTEIWQFSERAWPGPGLTHLDGPPRWPQRPVRLNTLFWPRGAGRFSIGNFLADQTALDLIRAAVFVDPLTLLPAWQPDTLVMADGDVEIRTDLYLLPARPLSQIVQADDSVSGLFLLTLVDERYLWYYRAASIAVVEGGTTWESLYESIATALDITLAVDTIPAAYLSPGDELTQRYKSLPLLLDTVGLCVNQRLVRALDGTCRMWNADASVTQQTLNLATLFDADLATAGTPVDKHAGGTFALGGDA